MIGDYREHYGKIRGGTAMQAINAIFDGNLFKPLEPIPVEGKYEVVITFTKPIDTRETRRQRILKHFGTWNDEDVKTINEIVEERINFSKNRNEL
jgi:predicted DNA-binding antitoxin AbrB/MazE fold protein